MDNRGVRKPRPYDTTVYYDMILHVSLKKGQILYIRLVVISTNIVYSFGCNKHKEYQCSMKSYVSVAAVVLCSY